jgi:hypothetical protein
MDLDKLRDPMWAAAFAAAATAAYIYGKAHINNEGKLPVSAYAKPASLVALLVYFIVSNGTGTKEAISTEPF